MGSIFYIYICMYKSYVSAKKSTLTTVYPDKHVHLCRCFISMCKNSLENVGCNVLKRILAIFLQKAVPFGGGRKEKGAARLAISYFP